MIFNNNGTSLSSNIPMAEGYDGTIGAAWALVESARNDYAMFRGMLDIDAREYNITQESTGYVAESQIATLHEAAIGGIWSKIKQIIEKFIAKIKAIIHKFVAKFSSLTMSGKQLVKKYGNEVLRKSNIDKLEVKWRKHNAGITLGDIAGALTKVDISNLSEYAELKHESDTDKRWRERTAKYKEKCAADNGTEFREALNEWFWADDKPETYEISETNDGNMRAIASTVETFEKKIKKLESDIRGYLNSWDKLAKEANKQANDAAKEYREKGTEDEKGKLDAANTTYEYVVVDQEIYNIATAFSLEAHKTYYAQAKAAFMKGVTVSEKKLESGVYDDEYASAIAEAAADEVEDVISGALSSEELSDLTAASKNVMDGDVANDPDKLTYGPDCYTEPKSSPYSRVDGSIDASIVGRNESALFDFKLV